MFELIFKILTSHMLGDYVLQSDFIARTKGENWYHLIVHSVLYVLPFYLFFGFEFDLLLVGFAHFAIDAGKARFKQLTYAHDQILHYMIAIVFLA